MAPAAPSAGPATTPPPVSSTTAPPDAGAAEREPPPLPQSRVSVAEGLPALMGVTPGDAHVLIATAGIDGLVETLGLAALREQAKALLGERIASAEKALDSDPLSAGELRRMGLDTGRPLGLAFVPGAVVLLVPIWDEGALARAISAFAKNTGTSVGKRPVGPNATVYERTGTPTAGLRAIVVQERYARVLWTWDAAPIPALLTEVARDASLASTSTLAKLTTPPGAELVAMTEPTRVLRAVAGARPAPAVAAMRAVLGTVNVALLAVDVGQTAVTATLELTADKGTVVQRLFRASEAVVTLADMLRVPPYALLSARCDPEALRAVTQAIAEALSLAPDLGKALAQLTELSGLRVLSSPKDEPLTGDLALAVTGPVLAGAPPTRTDLGVAVAVGLTSAEVAKETLRRLSTADALKRWVTAEPGGERLRVELGGLRPLTTAVVGESRLVATTEDTLLVAPAGATETTVPTFAAAIPNAEARAVVETRGSGLLAYIETGALAYLLAGARSVSVVSAADDKEGPSPTDAWRALKADLDVAEKALTDAEAASAKDRLTHVRELTTVVGATALTATPMETGLRVVFAQAFQGESVAAAVSKAATVLGKLIASANTAAKQRVELDEAVWALRRKLNDERKKELSPQ